MAGRAAAGWTRSEAVGCYRPTIEPAAERYDHEPFLTRVWELRHNLTAYDALYVALAEALDAPLVTCDARLGRAPLTGVTIEVIARPSEN